MLAVRAAFDASAGTDKDEDQACDDAAKILVAYEGWVKTRANYYAQYLICIATRIYYEEGKQEVVSQ